MSFVNQKTKWIQTLYKVPDTNSSKDKQNQPIQIHFPLEVVHVQQVYAFLAMQWHHADFQASQHHSQQSVNQGY